MHQTSHNKPFCNTKVHISVTKRCIVGYGTGASRDLFVNLHSPLLWRHMNVHTSPIMGNSIATAKLGITGPLWGESPMTNGQCVRKVFPCHNAIKHSEILDEIKYVTPCLLQTVVIPLTLLWCHMNSWRRKSPENQVFVQQLVQVSFKASHYWQRVPSQRIGYANNCLRGWRWWRNLFRLKSWL